MVWAVEEMLDDVGAEKWDRFPYRRQWEVNADNLRVLASGYSKMASGVIERAWPKKHRTEVHREIAGSGWTTDMAKWWVKSVA